MVDWNYYQTTGVDLVGFKAHPQQFTKYYHHGMCDQLDQPNVKAFTIETASFNPIQM